jgi:hypothetical protein
MNQLLRAESKPLRSSRVEENARTCAVFSGLPAEKTKIVDCLAGRQSYETPSPFCRSGCSPWLADSEKSARGPRPHSAARIESWCGHIYRRFTSSNVLERASLRTGSLRASRRLQEQAFAHSNALRNKAHSDRRQPHASHRVRSSNGE